MQSLPPEVLLTTLFPAQMCKLSRTNREYRKLLRAPLATAAARQQEAFDLRVILFANAIDLSRRLGGSPLPRRRTAPNGTRTAWTDIQHTGHLESRITHPEPLAFVVTVRATANVLDGIRIVAHPHARDKGTIAMTFRGETREIGYAGDVTVALGWLGLCE